jgi:hypothetical protein
MGKACVGALERSGPCPRGCAALERGGPRSRGVVEPSSEAYPARGGVYPSSEADFTRGASAASSWWAAGATRTVVVLCMRVRCVSYFAFAFFADFKRVSPWLFRGPLGLSPTPGTTVEEEWHWHLVMMRRGRAWN